jgi:arsenite/tail-anchored protein-transporting ATPase
MRTILFTGKGGVGKTSIAAATALRCADLGHRTVVLSTDLAHSLADSLGEALGPQVREVSPGLMAQEVDIYHELRRHWGSVQEYIEAIFAWRGLDEVIAEEMTVLPGMDELASLLLIREYDAAGEFDVCIVDCAPTGETLRLLSFPEVARWWVRSILPVQRRIAQVVRPIARRVIDLPIPGDEVYATLQRLMTSLEEMRNVLTDFNRATVRLVLNPERMVIKEAQRTFTYLNLYGYTIDAVVTNRVLAGASGNAFLESWQGVHEKHLALIDECFGGLPMLRVPWMDDEVVGPASLRRIASLAYGDADPSTVMQHGPTQSVLRDGEQMVLSVPLPLATKAEVEMLRAGDELIVKVGSHRRNILLPRALAGLDTASASFSDGVLRVRFDRATATDSSDSERGRT